MRPCSLHPLRALYNRTIGSGNVCRTRNDQKYGIDRRFNATNAALYELSMISQSTISTMVDITSARFDAGLDMLIRSLAIEQRRRNNRAIVVALHPGTVDTDLSRPFQGNIQGGRLFTPTAPCFSRLHQVGAAAIGGCYDQVFADLVSNA